MPVREEIGRYKYTENDAIDEKYSKVLADIKKQAEEIVLGRDE